MQSSDTNGNCKDPPTEGRLERLHERLWNVSDVILKYRLVNNTIPHAIWPYYATYEFMLRRSNTLRRRWANQPGRRSDERSSSTNIRRAQPAELYDPLPTEKSIRLLHIEAAGTDAESLVCSLRTYRLETHSPYFAISYSWGEDRTSTNLKSNTGSTISIQSSLCELLRRLQAKHGSVAVWIDAICIDQQNADEVNAQMEIMGDIYRQASSVIVWLGREDEHSDQVGTLFDLIETGRREQLFGWLPSLAVFLDRPWFSRTWVLQEVMLASSCSVWCGSRSWSWEHFRHNLEIVSTLETLDVYGIAHRKRQNVLGVADRVGSDASLSQADLMHLLVHARGLEATSELDKVYALLPLCRDRMGIRIRTAEASVRQLYEEVAGLLIRKGYNDILKHAGESVWNNVAGLPSWVPDWSCRDRPALLPSSKQQTLSEQPKRSSSIEVREHSIVLEVSVLGSIHKTGVPWPGNAHVKPSERRFDSWGASRLAAARLESWRSMFWPQTRYVATNESTIAAFLKTLVANSLNIEPAIVRWERASRAIRAVMMDSLQLGITRLGEDHEEVQRDMEGFFKALTTFCYKRTFFMTRDGCMGLGPFFTLPGDLVVSFDGVDGCFVVRRTILGRYRLIGQCYVHGYDDYRAEAMEASSRRRIAIE